jgi:predicted enzyme related to lactoylglutathione lyase
MEMTSYPPGTPSWVDLGTSDVSAAAAFYGGLFGWEVRDSLPDAGGYRLAELRGKPVAGLGPQMQPGMPPMWSTYIATADADATAKAVRDAGGQTFVPPMDVMDVGRMAVFADPSGAAFGVWQAGSHLGAGLVNEPNTLCWNELATRDPDAVIPFYRDVFGWEANTQEMGGMAYTEWQRNGKTVAGMMPMGDNFPAEVPSYWGLYFAVADADATAAKVTELGGRVHQPPMDIPVGRFALVADPQGAMFSVIKLGRQQ